MGPALDKETVFCANPVCTCGKPVSVERDGRLYCNESCAATPPGAEECSCDHDGCARSAVGERTTAS